MRLPNPDETKDPAYAKACAAIKASRGFVSNAFRGLGNAPEGMLRYAEVGRYVKYETDLPERLRELSILCAARGVSYAWTHHAALAVQSGIPQSAVEDIDAGRPPQALNMAERAIVRFIHEMFEPTSVSGETFAELASHFTPRQVTDIAMSAAYYKAFGAMAMAMGVQIEAPEVLQAERDFQKGRK
jgi:4-carboxymuconolactone decarboxylase